MGNIPSAFRREERGEDVELGADPSGARAAANPYRYPPKTGELYFGSSFWIGGQKFDMDSSDGFLFGDNTDVNFFSGRPRAFPFRVPQVGQPTGVLQALVNIRKDSLKLVRVEPESDDYRVEFTFDSDVPASVTVFFQATEQFADGILGYHSTPGVQSSPEPVLPGYGQTFKSSFNVAPSKLSQRFLTLPSDGPSGIYPLIVHCEVNETDLVNQQSHSHVLVANIEMSSDGVFSVKPVKQKQLIDGTVFLLQEIYGLDTTPNNGDDPSGPGRGSSNDSDDDDDDDSSQTGMECELCLSEPRDTMILPCRHLSICNSCADQLRFSASNCPFCRQPFSALLHIRAFREVTPLTSRPVSSGNTEVSNSELAPAGSPAGTPSSPRPEVPGHVEVTLLEAYCSSPSSQPGSLVPSPNRRPGNDIVAESLDEELESDVDASPERHPMLLAPLAPGLDAGGVLSPSIASAGLDDQLDPRRVSANSDTGSYLRSAANMFEVAATDAGGAAATVSSKAASSSSVTTVVESPGDITGQPDEARVCELSQLASSPTLSDSSAVAYIDFDLPGMTRDESFERLSDGTGRLSVAGVVSPVPNSQAAVVVDGSGASVVAAATVSGRVQELDGVRLNDVEV